MTAQFNDIFSFGSKPYALAGMSSETLFDPVDLGLSLRPPSTACRRGYVAHFALLGDDLILSRLEANIDTRDLADDIDRAPALRGVRPRLRSGPKHLFNADYTGLRHRIEYTGGVLIASEFIEEFYVHMGFHPAWKYRNVRELLFEGGSLVADHDKTAECAEMRARFMKRAPSKPGARPTEQELHDFVIRAFDRSY